MNTNILLYTHNYLSPAIRNVGEVESYCLLLCSLLSGIGYRFFNAYNTDELHSVEEFPNQARFLPDELFHVTSNTTVSEIVSFIRKHKINIINIHECGLISFDLFRQASIEAKCSIITTCHSKPYFILNNYTYSFCLSRLFKLNLDKTKKIILRMVSLPMEKKKVKEQIDRLYQKIFSCSDKVILPTGYLIPTMEQIIQRNIIYDECQVIYSCIQSRHFFLEDAIKIIKKTEILVVGIFDETRLNLNRVLAIWKKMLQNYDCHDWILRIVGDGNDYQNYKSKVQKINNVIIDGFESLSSCLNSCSIYLSLADLREFVDFHMIEAMQYAAIPIVSNSSLSVTDYIDNENSGYIISKDISDDKLCDILFGLMNDKKLREKMAKQCIQKIRTFTQQRFIEQYRSLYR